MSAKAKQNTVFANVNTMSPGTNSKFGGGEVSPAAGVQISANDVRAIRHTRLKITDLDITIAASADYGSAKIVDLPDTNITLLSIEADLELTKGLTTNGVVGATDVAVSIGTAAASQADLGNAGAANVLTKITLTATDDSPAFQAHSSEDASLTYPINLDDSATLALYLNLGAAITADDTVTVDGYIDLFWVDVGNVTS